MICGSDARLIGWICGPMVQTLGRTGIEATCFNGTDGGLIDRDYGGAPDCPIWCRVCGRLGTHPTLRHHWPWPTMPPSSGPRPGSDVGSPGECKGAFTPLPSPDARQFGGFSPRLRATLQILTHTSSCNGTPFASRSARVRASTSPGTSTSDTPRAGRDALT